jgi:hypothetical protein
VRDYGKFDSPNHDLGHPIIDHVLEIEPEILQTIEEEPNLSIRRLALRVGVFTFIVYRTLHEQGLLTTSCPTCLSSSKCRSISEDCFLSMAWPEDRRGTKFSIINNGRNQNCLIGPHNLPPRLNGAAYLVFLQNVLNDPVYVFVMQTAENIRENPEMLVRTQASLVLRTQACMNNEGRHFEHLL